MIGPARTESRAHDAALPCPALPCPAPPGPKPFTLRSAAGHASQAGTDLRSRISPIARSGGEWFPPSKRGSWFPDNTAHPLFASREPSDCSTVLCLTGWFSGAPKPIAPPLVCARPGLLHPIAITYGLLPNLLWSERFTRCLACAAARHAAADATAGQPPTHPNGQPLGPASRQAERCAGRGLVRRHAADGQVAPSPHGIAGVRACRARGAGARHLRATPGRCLHQ